MSHKKKVVVNVCGNCHEEDIVDVFSKLCKNCQGNDISLEDDDEGEEDW
ncbi:MAG: hypothetical protein Q7R52_00165 [archaeon]|nr:hypothetical protein [archaeon]